MTFGLQHPADQLVMIMERIYGYGMTTTSGGNLSIRDANGDVWITPAGIDKGTLSARDIVRIRPDGSTDGIHRPSSEYPFHLRIYRERPDLGGILHAHPPATVAFSVVRRLPDANLIPNARFVCGAVGLAEYGLPGSEELGEKIAAVFRQGLDTVVLENHGVVVGGTDLFRAFMAFETLDFIARLEIDARRLGTPRPLSDAQVALSKEKQTTDLPTFTPAGHSSAERAARREMVRLIHRAYDQKLFTSTQGTFSLRLPDGGFLITPYHVDRAYLDEADLVRIDGGRREEGKTPSRSVPLHAALYARQPHVEAVIVAHPPNIMAFAVTAEDFDSRTIPESYILLRDIRKLPFGATFLDPAGVAAGFDPAHPLALAANDCLIATGSSLLNAYDRLEVAEYSAKALIATKALGAPVLIDDGKVADLKKAFGLPD